MREDSLGVADFGQRFAQRGELVVRQLRLARSRARTLRSLVAGFAGACRLGRSIRRSDPDAAAADSA